MNILRFFGLDAKPCPTCGQTALPGHACKQPARWSRRGFLFLMAAAPVVAKVLPEPANESEMIQIYGPLDYNPLVSLTTIYSKDRIVCKVGDIVISDMPNLNLCGIPFFESASIGRHWGMSRLTGVGE